MQLLMNIRFPRLFLCPHAFDTENFLATRECVAYTADIVITIYISVVDLLSQLLFSYKAKNIDAQVMQVGTDRSPLR